MIPTKRLLIIDTDPVSRGKLQAIFESSGESAWDLTFCSRLSEGKSVIADADKNGKPFSVICIDLDSDLDEAQTWLHALLQMPVLIMVFTESSADLSPLATGKNGRLRQLRKPIQTQQILDVISENYSPPPAVQRILIVDDEKISRVKMQTLMATMGECVCAENGQMAVEAFESALAEKKPFDVVTLDIAMPEMDGMETLFNLRSIEASHHIKPDATSIIIMVTSHSRKGEIITCLQAGCNDYIVKPFNLETIQRKLDIILKRLNRRAIGEAAGSEDQSSVDPSISITAEVAEMLRKGEIDLPSLPKISAQLKQLIQNGADIQEIADLLKIDMAISSRLIRLSNSSFYRGVSENRTLEEAINRLGIDTTLKQAEAISHRRFVAGRENAYPELVEYIWNHSIHCAYASLMLAEHRRLKLIEDPFTMGLFHDIGKLILLETFTQLEKKGRFSDPIPRDTLIQCLDKLHGSFGAALMERWNFSESFRIIARYHDHPEHAEQLTPELAVIHIANQIAFALVEKTTDVRIPELMKSDSARLFSLTFQEIVPVMKKLEIVMAENKAMYL